MTLSEQYSAATRRYQEAISNKADAAIIDQLEREFNLARKNVLSGSSRRIRRGDVEGAILARQESEGGEVFHF